MAWRPDVRRQPSVHGEQHAGRPHLEWGGWPHGRPIGLRTARFRMPIVSSKSRRSPCQRPWAILPGRHGRPGCRAFWASLSASIAGRLTPRLHARRDVTSNHRSCMVGWTLPGTGCPSCATPSTRSMSGSPSASGLGQAWRHSGAEGELPCSCHELRYSKHLACMQMAYVKRCT